MALWTHGYLTVRVAFPWKHKQAFHQWWSHLYYSLWWKQTIDFYLTIILKCKYFKCFFLLIYFSKGSTPWERHGLSSIPSTMLTISLPMPVALWERTDKQIIKGFVIQKHQDNEKSSWKHRGCRDEKETTPRYAFSLFFFSVSMKSSEAALIFWTHAVLQRNTNKNTVFERNWEIN